MATDKGLEEIPESKLTLPQALALGTEKTSSSVASQIHDCQADKIPSAQIESNYDEVTDSFDSMSLKPELLRGMLYSSLCAGYRNALAYHCSQVYMPMVSSDRPLFSSALSCRSSKVHSQFRIIWNYIR